MTPGPYFMNPGGAPAAPAYGMPEFSSPNFYAGTMFGQPTLPPMMRGLRPPPPPMPGYPPQGYPGYGPFGTQMG